LYVAINIKNNKFNSNSVYVIVIYCEEDSDVLSVNIAKRLINILILEI